MIVRTREEILKSDRCVETPKFTSLRFLLKDDGTGFTLTETTLPEGSENEICYKNHIEAVYCIEGEAEVQVLEPEPKTYVIKPGTMYALNMHDRHILRIRKTFRAICVFFPPLTGREVHDADGSYTLSE